MPPTMPPVAEEDSVLAYAGEAEGEADMTTAEMGMLESRLSEATMAAVVP
jgi:hypothetical protein